MEYSLEKLVTSMWEHRKNKDFERKSLESSYRGLKVKASIGMTGNISKIPWISYCAKGQETRKGIYPVLLFYGTQEFLQENLNHVNVRKIVLAYGVSATQKPDVQWGAEVEGKKTIKEAFAEWKYETADTIIKKYNSSYIYKVYNWDDSVNYELIQKDIDAIIDTYLQILEKISLPVKSREPLPLKKRTLNFNILQPKYYPYLAALRTKPFMLLAGISGTGKSRIVREMAKACWKEGDPEYGKNHPGNFCMVQVKPNWHDSSELIGYVSRLNGEKFVVGPFLRFLAAALKEPEVPYFLCLDEMNLAPVEQYFAEYLSAIESRKLNPDGTITTDPIIEYENTDAYGSLIDQLFDTPEERKAYKTDEGGKRLTIPQNFFVVGTVNMDETTFSFSRKVLDRAMTIEMNEVDLHGGLEKGAVNEIGYIGNCIIGDAAEGCDIYEDNRDLCDHVLAYLEQVNAILEGTPFKIAYRTRNEFLMYAVNRKKLDEKSQLWQSLDEMTSMKILSRIEGDEERTKKVLDSLKALVDEQIVAQMPTDAGETQALQSISAAKIKEMLEKLQATGFTSYWA